MSRAAELSRATKGRDKLPPKNSLTPEEIAKLVRKKSPDGLTYQEREALKKAKAQIEAEKLTSY